MAIKTRKQMLIMPKDMRDKKYFVIEKGADLLTNQLISGEITHNYFNAVRLTNKVDNGQFIGFRTAREAVRYLAQVEEDSLKRRAYHVVTHGMDQRTGKIITDKLYTSYYNATECTEGVPKGYIKTFSSAVEALQYFEEKVQRARNGKMKSSVDSDVSETVQSLDQSLTGEKELHDKETIHLYVDGSFNERRNVYSYGFTCSKDGKILYIERGVGRDREALELRHVAGELFAAIRALLYAKQQGYRKVILFHDFEGIQQHATGIAKQQNSYTHFYRAWMEDFQENAGVEVFFSKVAAHTGNPFNELADGLAKEAAGIEPHSNFYRMYYRHCLHIPQPN